jgi:ribosomal protein L29
MTVEELNKQIDQSEYDLANNRFKPVPNYLSSTNNGF